MPPVTTLASTRAGDRSSVEGSSQLPVDPENISTDIEQQLVDVVEAERRRLGQEFHDGLGQRLTSLGLSAAILREKLSLTGRAEAADAARLVMQIEETVREARSLVRGLYPAWIVQNGLEKTLQELLDRIQEVSERRTVLHVGEWQRIAEPERAMHMFRIVQEAVNNAIKHSECSTITVRLDIDDGRRRIIIEDDGRGIPEGAAAGIGLRLMIYRAELIGGRLTIGSRSGGGTRIELLVERSDVGHQDRALGMPHHALRDASQ